MRTHFRRIITTADSVLTNTDITIDAHGDLFIFARENAVVANVVFLREEI